MGLGRPTSTTNKPKQASRAGGHLSLQVQGTSAVLSVSGLIDESFQGFGKLPDDLESLVIDVSRISRMTSFGVRQWLKAMDGLPRKLTDLYLLGCPTFVVDQMNMVLNFGGSSKVLTVQAPFACTGCGAESSDKVIDVLANRAKLIEGSVPEQVCARCNATLEFDEAPESYFAFVSKYGATTISSAAAEILDTFGLYRAPERDGEEKPPKIFKIVQESVTYFKISGVLGRLFRARPLAVGAEGEVVLDLGEVERFAGAGQREWERLIRQLSTQVNAITLVDVPEAMLQAAAAGNFRLSRHFAIWSIRVVYKCNACGKAIEESVRLTGHAPRLDEAKVCPSCGGATASNVPPQLLAPLEGALPPASIPAASTRFISNRSEIVSRVMVEASIARGGEGISGPTGGGDTILGKYRIVKPLSAGGMAEVFLAKQVGIGGFEKTVALKRILRSFLENRHLAVDLFLNEAKIAARLVHPNIVQVLDVGEDKGSLYLAMEYVHGCDLRVVTRALKQRGDPRLPVAEVLYIAREVANALHHAYYSADLEGNQNHVVHRDVSPHNILLSYEGSVKLSDFGVAVSSVTNDKEALVTGKWAYMSPEQTLGQKLDHRSDLFSLGIVLYQLLAGTHPFVADNVGELVVKLRKGDMVPLGARRHDLPEALTWLVDRMLSLSPEDRPRHGQAVVSAIAEIARTERLELRAEGLAGLLGGLFVDQARSPSLPPESLYFVKQSGTTSMATPSQVTDSSGQKTTLSPGPPAAYEASQPPKEEASKSYPLVEILDMARAAEVEPENEMPPPLPQFMQERQPSGFAVKSSTLFILTVIVVVAVSVAAYLVLGPLIRGLFS